MGFLLVVIIIVVIIVDMFSMLQLKQKVALDEEIALPPKKT